MIITILVENTTGIEPYNQLKVFMGERIDYLQVGSEVTI